MRYARNMNLINYFQENSYIPVTAATGVNGVTRYYLFALTGDYDQLMFYFQHKFNKDGKKDELILLPVETITDLILDLRNIISIHPEQERVIVAFVDGCLDLFSGYHTISQFYKELGVRINKEFGKNPEKCELLDFYPKPCVRFQYRLACKAVANDYLTFKQAEALLT